MIQEGRRGPPHAAVLVAVVIAVMVLPSLIGVQCEAVGEFLAELLSPLALLVLAISLIFVIRFISSDA
ncbi:transmembrane protein [Salvia divinorum]|uniref:Transmembrane protein n=1 Tax=Salvia divinorum TaxID=28513 RepID=A0ABD1FWR8_SALDI